MKKRVSNAKTVQFFHHFYGKEDSDISVKIVIDARKIVPMNMIRQDMMHLNFHSYSSANSLVRIEVDHNMNIQEAKEVIKEKFNLTHIRLWYPDQSSITLPLTCN